MIWCFLSFAAAHLQQKGLDEADAARLVSAFSKMGIEDAVAMDVSEWRLSRVTTAWW